MIRLVIIALVLFLLFFVYMHIRDEHYTRAQRKKALQLGLVGLASLSLFIVVFEYARQWQLHQALITAQFEETGEQSYSTSLNEVRVMAKYESGYEPEQSVPRLVLKVTLEKPFKDLASMFCDKTELERFLAFNYGRRYPTPEIKLPNGHFVGKCYPKAIVEKVNKMADRQHDFVPKNARYLFLPSVHDEQHTVYFYTENLDIETLRTRLSELLEYYKLVARY